MSNPVELRQAFLEGAVPFMQQYLATANGEAVFACPDKAIRDNVWDVISKIIVQADDPVKLKGLGEGTITEQVDLVLLNVAEGNVTIQQGKRLIEMLQAGFEITELPKMILALDNMEKK